MSKRDFNARPRVERGFYPTPWEAFEPLAAAFEPVDDDIWEPCAGDGALCRHMARVGWNVRCASDIMPASHGVGEKNALDITVPLHGPFITNPPWPEAGRKGEPTLSIAMHLSSLAPTWLLLPADWMHNVCNADAMARCRWIVSVGRVKWIADSPHAGFDNCAWFLFAKDRLLGYPDGVMKFTPRQ